MVMKKTKARGGKMKMAKMRGGGMKKMRGGGMGMGAQPKTKARAGNENGSQDAWRWHE